MKRILLTLPLLALFAAACSDFGNSRRSTSSGNGIVGEPGRPQKNPFPEGQGFENPNEGAFTESKMLVNIGVNAVAKSVKAFSLQAQMLNESVGAYCEALEFGEEALQEEGEAKDAWKRTMLAYHEAEAVPVGPLTDTGRYLADNIYSWPYFYACGVDLEVIRVKDTGSSNPQKLFTVKGLTALEYLLFEPSLGTSCNANAQPKAAAWAAQDAHAKRAQRCAYARELTQDLVQKAKLLDEHWDPMEGNFSKRFVDGSRYPSVREATNALSDGIFVLEIMKDQKVGRPLGRHKDCISGARKCPESVQHPYAGIDLEAIEAHLKGFRSAFFGHASPRARAFGFDDFLADQGHPEVARRIRSELDRAMAELRSLQGRGTFAQQIAAMDPQACAATTPENPLEPLCLFFHELRSVTTTMKVEVLSVLRLRAPPFFGGGDND